MRETDDPNAASGESRLQDAIGDAPGKLEHLRRIAAPEGGMDRRSFLKLMGASLAFAGLTGCSVRKPAGQILPYVRQPEEIIPGKPLFYASAATLDGYARGVLVETHEGRPTKIEGNPDHPASLGATDLFAQASVLTLYDPDRARGVSFRGETRTYQEFLTELRKTMATQRARQGTGLRLLTGSVTSPTLAEQLQKLLSDLPGARWHQFDPVGRGNSLDGARLAFGAYVEPIYQFDKANVVLSLDADFLTTGPASLRYSRDLMARRHVQPGQGSMSRLYVAESTPSCTGAVADHRLPIKATQIESLGRALANSLGVSPAASNQSADATLNKWIDGVAHDLNQNRGAGVVIAGDGQPPFVHALAFAINDALGNVGKTVSFVDAVRNSPTDQLASLGQLVTDLRAGAVELLVVLDCNPAYTAPADLNVADSLSRAAMRIHHSLYFDETSALCDWHIPASHELESWGDARTYDGTATIIQPMIAPLHESRSAYELLAALSDQPERSGLEIVRDYWTRQHAGNAQAALTSPATQPANQPPTQAAPTSAEPSRNQQQNASPQFEAWWQSALRAGVVPNTAAAPRSMSLSQGWQNTPPSTTQPASPGTALSERTEIVFRADPTVYDGRYANNSWLQELPKPLTNLTWDNAALVSPAMADRLGLSSEVTRFGGNHGGATVDVLELSLDGRSTLAPAWVMPGQADDSITVYLGYGRRQGGSIAAGKGFDAYQLRTTTAMWIGRGVEVRKTAERYTLAATGQHHWMEGRELVRAASLSDYLQHPDFPKREADDPSKAVSLYPEWDYPSYAWGMVIDTSVCTGCSACVVACQAENNIPVVGKEEVLRAREMHWLRIDRYTHGDEHHPWMLLQPVPCMHCEKAPCEVVCPTEATQHSNEGLNEMVYNRCVGTRYCSNNCPYKVRRFNFFTYSADDMPLVQLQYNPDVTVRSRGVMEKCTYCVQRIQQAKIASEKEDRVIRDGEVVTACQAACPTGAIIFGDLNDPNSRVSRLRAEPRNYGLLAELNTQPRTTYLATVRNPNPELE